MKLKKTLVLLSAAMSLLTSCALPDLQTAPGAYCIKTRDGREVLCDGKPLLQEKTGYYRYRTYEKRDGVIRQDDVASIEKRNA